MILYIAEKPSLGRAIADVLPKPLRKQEGYVEAANGDCVSWCVGHLLEQAEPDAYDAKYKSWKLADLPIVPDIWQLKPKKTTAGQLKVLKKLVAQAEQLVHAGDPDREGQLLVDEVLAYLKVSKTKLANTQRLLISDLNPSAVKRALGAQRSNHEFVPLSTSALARSRADWLYGMNLTRAFTLQGRKVGFQGVLSVGRVQTPVLGLVVRRDETINDFQPKPFYEVEAELQTERGESFKAKWKPSEACQPWMDEDGRVLVKGLAENVVSRIAGQRATVESVEQKQKRQSPPLPYNLSSLQIDCNKRFGLSAQEVLDSAQALYERYKLITYPRSDSRYLPQEQLADAGKVLKAIEQGASELIQGCDAPNPSLKSKAWNDSKVDAHHAIIPTAKAANLAGLSTRERQVYLQVARQYLAQFYEAYIYWDTKVTVMIAGGTFKTSSKRDQQLGWKQLFCRDPSGQDDEERQPQLPELKQGQPLTCERGEVQEKITQPPKHFTDASLLSAMTGISRYVSDPQIRKVLKETDGLGTEATRAGIIELLCKRGFLSRQGKTILATDAGKGLINSLPIEATLPDMTAQWESSLDAICRKEIKYQTFMVPLLERINGLITQVSETLPQALAGVKTSKPAFRRKRSYRGKAKTTTKKGSKTKVARSPQKTTSE
ncbi:DNA topoisomerase III [Celerinatantimonas diazotrophica]|uniref:DNA topoisomerase 3 n=1 Tax=Celerinatantimonas diazotrophica TaxID=412034 RepID=A0A4R1K1Y3_9GAMM|nr:DNA topoisomerase III [Celerinatantimonas diazotrophica]TCK58005.1 DNA topoisomerase-3 [Celerinatantimonas diazotrophica]CAG9297926.1 DNA topoisomerase 3 [Celerinatantimonas diazotrophica]